MMNRVKIGPELTLVVAVDGDYLDPRVGVNWG